MNGIRYLYGFTQQLPLAENLATTAKYYVEVEAFEFIQTGREIEALLDAEDVTS